MAVDFTRKDPPWVDVPDPENPPAGASKIMASDLNRYEDALEGLAAESGAIEVDTSVGTRITIGGHMVFYDTGPRDISGTLDTLVSGTMVLRRVNSTVFLTLTDMVVEELSTSWAEFPFFLPIGFRPSGTVYLSMPQRNANYTAGPFRVVTNGTVTIYGMGDNNLAAIGAVFEAAPRLPSTLPGTPA